ncbi:hypothetical protein BLNAU_1817 [Blattamonas nauphoetae]|uniref:Uncharacterized protein n=1 Tax=Blattamonas nauphoetae TaxID=2049346 RepID=A0ABQ9YHR5_9EUKA|nr:hypothetical protein BLNAU_1817 [Blattamonas nauphoetae]
MSETGELYLERTLKSQFPKLDFRNPKNPDNPFQPVGPDDDTQYWLVKIPSTFDPHVLNGIKFPIHKLSQNPTTEQPSKVSLGSAKVKKQRDKSTQGKETEQHDESITLHFAFSEHSPQEIQAMAPLIFDSSTKTWKLGKQFSRNITIFEESPLPPVLPPHLSSQHPIPSEKTGLSVHCPPKGFGFSEDVLKHERGFVPQASNVESVVQKIKRTHSEKADSTKERSEHREKSHKKEEKRDKKEKKKHHKDRRDRD